MDPLVARLHGYRDADLVILEEHGIAYQADMTTTVPYDQAYFDKLKSYEGQLISNEIHKGRVKWVERFMSFPYDKKVLDIGIGSGEFIRHRKNTFGYDVNPSAISWLHKKEKWADDFAQFEYFTMWDVLEHVPNPSSYLERMPDNSWLFLSIPLFKDLTEIRKSKHYRPNEHYWYFRHDGLVKYMDFYRFTHEGISSFETKAGRDSIISFAFKKRGATYESTIDQYKLLHRSTYGTSAHLFLEYAAPVILRLNPNSILDYGCGNGNFAGWFWKDGARQIVRYDPAIPDFGDLPKETFDLVLCMDVMEHIRMADVDRVLAELRSKSDKVIFTISMRPARTHLEDGRNAHVTLLSEVEWMNWVRSYFGKAVRIDTKWDHVLMLRTW